MQVVVVTHVTCYQVLAVRAQCKRRYAARSSGQRHKVHFFGGDCVPHKNHRFKTNLACSHKLSVLRHSKSFDIVAMSVFSLFRLKLVYKFCSAPKNDLGACCVVQNDAQLGSHVDWLAF